jgi:predicted ATPase
VVRANVQEALSESWQTAIIGEAGTGKITLLYWLAVNSAADTFEGSMDKWRNTVPFIIAILRTELGRYHSQGAKFLEVRM